MNRSAGILDDISQGFSSGVQAVEQAAKSILGLEDQKPEEIETPKSELSPPSKPALNPQPDPPSAKPIKSNTKVHEFKQYLHANGLYQGDIKSDEIDRSFIDALKNTENLIAKLIEQATGKRTNTAGLIWTGSTIDSNTSPDDIEAAINTLNSVISKQNRLAASKTAQTTVDTFVPNEPPPSAFKFVQTQDDQVGGTGDMIESQQIGLNTEKLPANSVNPLDIPTEVTALPPNEAGTKLTQLERFAKLIQISGNNKT